MSTDELGTSRIHIGGDNLYDVVIGRAVLDTLAPLLEGAGKVGVIHAASVASLTDEILAVLKGERLDAFAVEVPDAEAAKTADVAARCWAALGQAGMTRSDAIVGVGGGATTDLAGFVAASWLRGVRWVPVPTTMLGMVDAAVGGKTGINTVEGKNLVGAFHPPAGVVCDLEALATLPPREYVAGLAEVVKGGFIADPGILDIIEGDLEGAKRPDGPHAHELVARKVQVKADVVGADLRESGPREILNYGHTLAHAIEKVEKYQWRHGAAVSVGMVFAAELGRLAGRLDGAAADRHRTVLEGLGLPTSYRADAWDELLTAMRVDKKARGSKLRFVVLDGLGKPDILEDPPEDLLKRAFAAISA